MMSVIPDKIFKEKIYFTVEAAVEEEGHPTGPFWAFLANHLGPSEAVADEQN